MQAKQLDKKFIIRLDPHEEIVSSLKDFCAKNQVKVGSISGIGSIEKVSLKYFKKDTKEFIEKTLEQDLEIISLIGNVTTLDKETYIHLHITLSDEYFHCVGGHLSECWVGATCEVVIDQEDGGVEREFSEEIGLNIFKLD